MYKFSRSAAVWGFRPMPRAMRLRWNASSLAIWLIVAVIVLVPAAYILLSGPAVWLFQHGYMTRVLPWIYYPLAVLEVSDTLPGELIKWYWSLWK